jgi:hypothetical protein
MEALLQDCPLASSSLEAVETPRFPGDPCLLYLRIPVDKLETPHIPGDKFVITECIVTIRAIQTGNAHNDPQLCICGGQSAAALPHRLKWCQDLQI